MFINRPTTKPLIVPRGLAHCTKCDLKENLWLCLTCGSLGCGRQQFGGIGGNGHGLQHFEETKHPISVKLGTITPEGGAGTLVQYVYWQNLKEFPLQISIATLVTMQDSIPSSRRI